MKLFSIVATFTTALITIASASPTNNFYVTEPTSKRKTYRAGQTMTLKWLNGGANGFSLHLVHGKDSANMQDTGLTFSGADGPLGSYEWAIPDNFGTGTFAFRFVYDGGENYSPKFNIKLPDVSSGGWGDASN